MTWKWLCVRTQLGIGSDGDEADRDLIWEEYLHDEQEDGEVVDIEERETS